MYTHLTPIPLPITSFLMPAVTHKTRQCAMDINILPNQPLTHQSALRDVTSFQLEALPSTLALGSTPSLRAKPATASPISASKPENRAASPGMHPHSRCPVLCHSAEWNRCLWISQQLIPRGKASTKLSAQPESLLTAPARRQELHTPPPLHLLNASPWVFSTSAGHWRESEHTFNQFKEEVTGCGCLQPGTTNLLFHSFFTDPTAQCQVGSSLCSSPHSSFSTAHLQDVTMN